MPIRYRSLRTLAFVGIGIAALTLMGASSCGGKNGESASHTVQVSVTRNPSTSARGTDRADVQVYREQKSKPVIDRKDSPLAFTYVNVLKSGQFVTLRAIADFDLVCRVKVDGEARDDLTRSADAGSTLSCSYRP